MLYSYITGTESTGDRAGCLSKSMSMTIHVVSLSLLSQKVKATKYNRVFVTPDFLSYQGPYYDQIEFHKSTPLGLTILSVLAKDVYFLFIANFLSYKLLSLRMYKVIGWTKLSSCSQSTNIMVSYTNCRIASQIYLDFLSNILFSP